MCVGDPQGVFGYSTRAHGDFTLLGPQRELARIGVALPSHGSGMGLIDGCVELVTPQRHGGDTPMWNGTFHAMEMMRGVVLRADPWVPLLRVSASGRTALFFVEGNHVLLARTSAADTETITVTAIDAWGGESAPREVHLMFPPMAAADDERRFRLVSGPRAAWSVWERLGVFGAVPFFTGFIGVSLAMRRRRAR